LDAAVRFAAYSSDPEIVAIKNQVVDCLLENQQDDGYIGFLPKDRVYGRPGIFTKWRI
jgi:hypothetical protein